MKTGVQIACLIVFILNPLLSSSQKSFYLLGGIEFAGSSYGTQFQQNGAILQDMGHFRSQYNEETFVSGGINFNFNLGIQYELSEHLIFEAGFNLSEIDLIVHDQYFQDQNSVYGRSPGSHTSGAFANLGNFDFAKWFYAFYASSYYFFGDQQRKLRPYINAGLAYHFYSPGSQDLSGSYFHEPTNQDLVMTAHYNSEYLSGFIEGGIKLTSPSSNSKLSQRPSYFIGLRYSHAATIISGDYVNTQNGSILYTDQATTTGSCLALVLKMNVSLMGKGSRESKFKSKSKSTLPGKKQKDHTNKDQPPKLKVNSREN